MKKPGIVVAVLAVVVVSYFVMAYAVAQTCGAVKPAATAAPSTCGGCPSAAAAAPAPSGCASAATAAPAGCPMAAKKSGKSPEIVKALPEGQVRLSWQPGASRGAKVLKLAVEGSDSQAKVTAYYMSTAGNHALKLTPAGAGVYTAPVKAAPGAELAVRVTGSNSSNVVYFGLPQWGAARANCACPGGVPTADCKCPGMNCNCPGCDCETTGKCTCADCKCETTGKCTCPANKAIGSDCNCPGCDCKTTGKCTCADCKCETTGKCTCPGNMAAAGSSCGARPAVASCGAKAKPAAAKACCGCR